LDFKNLRFGKIAKCLRKIEKKEDIGRKGIGKI